MFENVPSSLEYGGKLAISITSVTAFVILLYRKFIKPMWLWATHTNDIIFKLDEVLAQLSTNGGSSMRDAIDRMEIKQIQQEQRSKALMIDQQDGIFECDQHGGCTWVNRTYLKMVERQLDEIKGFGWLNGICPSNREEVRREWASAVAEKREFEMMVDYQNRHGVIIPMFVKAYPILNGNNLVTGYVGTCSKLPQSPLTTVSVKTDMPLH